MIKCKKTLTMKHSNLQTLTIGDYYDLFYDREENAFVLNDQADIHYFPEPYLDEYFTEVTP